MITRHAQLPDYFLELEKKDSFGEYARTYGDQLATHYESNGIIYVPHMPIAFDVDFLQLISMPKALKKIGTIDGIERPVIQRQGANLGLDATHPLVALFKNHEVAIYLQNQIAQFNAQLRQGLSQLFPRYYSLKEGNITWRLTETAQEGMHFDIFNQGMPLSDADKNWHRVKLFINIDSEPRHWRTTLDFPGVLKTCRYSLPDELPDDVNVVSDIIDRCGVLRTLPFHEIAYPTMSAVIANGETVAHEVMRGRRCVGVEFFCDKNDMLNPAKHSHIALKTWLRENNYAVAPDALAAKAKVAHLKGGYAVLQEKMAG
jgi:hypothetical protein